MKEIHVETNDHSKIWMVIPAYNEETTLGQILKELCNKGYSIIVIDDCSKDETCQVALKYPVVVLRHAINLGQGAALQTGFDFLNHYMSATCIVTFDSDGQHSIEDIPKVIEPVLNGTYDVVLGSRFKDTKFTTLRKNGMPFSKFLTLKMGIFFTRLTTRLRVTDTHNGLRALSGKALKEIHIAQNRMAHGSEILSQIAKAKIPFCEVPVEVKYTDYSKKKGQSIFNSINIIWDLFIGRDE